MLGPYSSLTKAIAPETEKYGVPMVEQMASRSLFTKGYKYLFAVAPANLYLDVAIRTAELNGGKG